MLWYKTAAPIVAPYEPSEIPVSIVNSPENQIVKVEKEWEYYGRDETGEKIYEPYLAIEYKENGRFGTHVINGQTDQQMMANYNEWAKSKNMIPVPVTEPESDYKKDYSKWMQEAQEAVQEKEELADAAELDKVYNKFEKGQRPRI